MDGKQALENHTELIVVFIFVGSPLEPFLVLPGYFCILDYIIMSQCVSSQSNEMIAFEVSNH